MFAISDKREYLLRKEGAMSTLQIVLTIIVIVAVVLIAAAIWMATRRRSLQRRFGPEYERVVSQQDSRLAAERELRERERRHADLELRELSEESRGRYSAAWQEIQARFVDAPNQAVGEADELVTRLIAERGYPTDDYDERLAQLSVEHARTLEHYRDAHDINRLNERGEASTEQLRQALVHYRALFADLLGEPDDFATPAESEADAAAAVPPTEERSVDARPERAP